MTGTGWRHWLVVLTLAIAVHAALLNQIQLAPEARPVKPQTQGVRIALAAEQSPPQAEKTSAEETPETAPRAAPEPEPTPEPEPEPKPDPKPESEPKPEPAPKSKPEPEPTPVPEPEPVPEPQPEPQPEPKTERRPPATAKTPATDKPDTTARATSKQATQSRQPRSPGSVSDTPPDYRSKLSAWLARHKNYPRRARRLGQEGTAILYFVMDRDGRILQWEIRQSSGHKLLDDAVEKMIRNANPMPALPDSVAMQRLALTVPIRFRLR